MSTPDNIDEWIARAAAELAPIAEGGAAKRRQHRADVRRDIEAQLGDQLDAFSRLLALSRALSAVYPDDGDGDQAVKSRVLQGLHAQSYILGDELELLARNGFVEGFFARSRTLYELTVLSTLLAQEPPWRSPLFELWSLWEHWRSYSNYLRLAEEAGVSPHHLPDDDEFEEAARAARSLVRERLAVQADGSYGWMAESTRARPTFADVEGRAGRGGSRPWYLMGNRSVHATATPPGSLPDGLAFEPASDEDHEVLLDVVKFVGRCVVDIMEVVSGMGWHPTPDTAESVSPFVMAAESALREMNSG